MFISTVTAFLCYDHCIFLEWLSLTLSQHLANETYASSSDISPLGYETSIVSKKIESEIFFIMNIET